MKIFISCGETSGDRYASELVIALKKHDSDIAIFANGGSYLAEQGAIINSHTTMNSTVGFIEPLRHIGFFLGVMSKTKKMILKQKIDVVIIIDHQGFNIPLAKWCKKNNIPVISLFAPQFWMWGNVKRGKQFVKYCDLIATVFSKEHDFYSKIAPNKTMFIGHPLVHELPDKIYSERTVLALFPGSRRQEINHLLPLMISAATKIKKQYPNLQIKLALSSEEFRNEIESQVKDCGIEIDIITNSDRKSTRLNSSH